MPALLRFKRFGHPLQALKLARGRFPPCISTELEQRFGHAVHNHLETLENNLSKTYIDEQKTASVERALDKLNWFSVCLNIEKYGI